MTSLFLVTIVASRTEKQSDIEYLLYKYLDKGLMEYVNIMGVEEY